MIIGQLSNKKKHSKTIILNQKRQSVKKYLWLLPFILIFIIAYYQFKAENNFHFCFVDDTKNEAISTYLDIKVLQEHESPTYLKTDSLGCFIYNSAEKKVKFVVQSPYYKTDTIVKTINSNSNSTVKLHTDTYHALMLHYYTNGNIKDLEERKVQLKNLIADDAQIYQVFKANIGIEIYSKNDFINKLTIPTNSLKNISILERSYQDGKIVKLKFIVK